MTVDILYVMFHEMSIGNIKLMKAIYNIGMAFSDWITDKYVAWRGDAVGRDRTVTEFADWVGVSQSVMAYWMRPDGKLPRSTKSINALVSKYGPEVYEVLGLEPPQTNPILGECERLFYQLDDEGRNLLVEIIRRIATGRYVISDIVQLNQNVTDYKIKDGTTDSLDAE